MYFVRNNLIQQDLCSNMSQPEQPASQEMADFQKVHSLIIAMYSPEERSKAMASEMLENFQKSIFAWKVSDELLIKKLDFESCYFAAQTLKMKTQHYLDELPTESIDSLKESIINHLLTIDHKSIKTQLSLSLVYIYFFHQAWTNPIEELSHKLPREKFFEVVTLIAQEVKDVRLLRCPNEVDTYLMDNVPLMMSSLVQYYNSISGLADPEPGLIIVFTCFEAWVSIANQDQVAHIEPVLTIIFTYLQQVGISADLHDKATDALCRTIYMCTKSHPYTQLMSNITTQVFQLEEAYTMAVGYEDTGKVLNFARIFTELGNSNLEELLANKVDMKLLELIIKCVSHYDFEVAETTFSFFYNFSEEVYKHSTTKFVNCFNMLLNAVTNHCRLEADTVGLSDPDSDQFAYRDLVKSLLEEIVPCSDWVAFFESINVGQLLANSTWDVTEMYLYIIYCILSNREAFEHTTHQDHLIQEIITFILTLRPNGQPNQPWPQHHLQIYATSCDIFGKLSTWLDRYPSFLEPTIDFLIQIINQSYNKEPQLTSIASKALQEVINLCVECSLSLPSIISLFSNMLYITSQLKDFDVKLNMSIISCCTTIVSSKNVKESDKQEAMFLQLVQLCVSKFDGITEPKTNLEAFYENCIDSIYSTFKNFSPNEHTRNSMAIHSLLQDKIWPFIKLALTTFSPHPDNPTVEHSSRCLRHIVRSMQPIYLLKPIVEFIVPLYEQYPANTSPLIYVGAVLADEFANPNDPDLCNGLIFMLNSFLQSTLNILTNDNLLQYPFTMDDFYTLCYRLLSRMPQAFLSNTEALDKILNLLNQSFYIDQKETSETLVKFAIQFIKQESPVVVGYINGPFGIYLINSIIDAIIFKLPSYFLPDMIDPLWTFKTRYPEKFVEAIRCTTTNLAEKAKQGNYKVTEKDLEKFYSTIIVAHNAKRLVVELRSLQRLF